MTHLDDTILNEYLDQALDQRATEAVGRHLARCDDCRLRLDDLARLFGALETLSDVPLPVDLSPLIVAKLTAEARPIAVPRWLTTALVFQLFIAGAILVLLWPTTREPISQLGQATGQIFEQPVPLPQPGTILAPLRAGLEQLADFRALPSGVAINGGLWPWIAGLSALAWLVGNGLLLVKKETKQNAPALDG